LLNICLHPLRIPSTGLLLLVLLPAVAAEAAQPAEMFLAQCEKEYGISSVTTTASELDPASLRLAAAGLQRTAVHRLKSRQPVTPGSDTYLRLSLSVYIYEDEPSAAAAFAAFRETEINTEEMFRSKAPLLALRRAAEIYLLDGSCLYSAERLEAIQQALTGILFPAGPPVADQRLQRRCGGVIIAPSE